MANSRRRGKLSNDTLTRIVLERLHPSGNRRTHLPPLHAVVGHTRSRLLVRVRNGPSWLRFDSRAAHVPLGPPQAPSPLTTPTHPSWSLQKRRCSHAEGRRTGSFHMVGGFPPVSGERTNPMSYCETPLPLPRCSTSTNTPLTRTA